MSYIYIRYLLFISLFYIIYVFLFSNVFVTSTYPCGKSICGNHNQLCRKINDDNYICVSKYDLNDIKLNITTLINHEQPNENENPNIYLNNAQIVIENNLKKDIHQLYLKSNNEIALTSNNKIVTQITNDIIKININIKTSLNLNITYYGFNNTKFELYALK